MPEVTADLNDPRQAPNAPRHPQAAPTSSPHPQPFRKTFDFGHAFDPARIEPALRHAPAGRRRRGPQMLLGLAVLVLSVVAGFAATRVESFNRDALASLFGFGIEQVSLSGHRFTPDSELFDALNLNSARSLASFDPQAIRERFERLAWVQSVEISRVWPGQLAIRVTERRPFAVWERGEGAELVDASGRVLGPVKRDAVLDLPRIAGEGAAKSAAQLFSVLDRHPEIKARLVRADRHGDRRWTLELRDGGRIHLPSDGETSALARLAAEPQLASLVAKPGQIIDLRSPTKIAIRNTAAMPVEGAGER